MKKKALEKEQKKKDFAPVITHKPKASSSMFFSHNSALGPPYRVIICILLTN
jgi:hypothetical protein